MTSLNPLFLVETQAAESLVVVFISKFDVSECRSSILLSIIHSNEQGEFGALL